MTQTPGQSRMPIPEGSIIVGGQWGSEGKGAFIYEYGRDYDLHVRTGGPQAGHSIKLPDGEVLKLQCIPVGAALGKDCVIAMQSVIDADVLHRELAWFRELGIKVNLTIDPAATILTADDIGQESERKLTERLGSTSKGVGAARASRIMRESPTAEQYFTHNRVNGIRVEDTRPIINSFLSYGTGVLVEAAQGIMLSLFSSGYYPYVTSCEATPTGAFAEMGLPLREAGRFEAVGVFRTYPIRVAGLSGPMGEEITWAEVEARRGAPIDDSEKQTTVTKKVRRVAEWNAEEARRAVVEQGLSWAALTFVDYVHPEIAGETAYSRFPANVKRFIAKREADLGIPVPVVGTGFGTYAWRL